jgi:hypothetical protein
MGSEEEGEEGEEGEDDDDDDDDDVILSKEATQHPDNH